MKTQTKIATLVTVLVIGLSSVVSAQGISFGIRAGVNMQNINGKDMGGDKLTNKLIPGFNAGINVEIPVAPEFYVQPGLLFSTKGAQTSEVNGSLIEGTSYNQDLDVVYQNKVVVGDAVDKVYVRPFDAGANFIIGYETGMGLSAQLNAQLGLLEMIPDYEGLDMKKATQKNTGFGISLGYRF